MLFEFEVFVLCRYFQKIYKNIILVLTYDVIADLEVNFVSDDLSNSISKRSKCAYIALPKCFKLM